MSASATGRPPEAPGPDRDRVELDALRAEVSALRARLDTRQRRAGALLTLRRVGAAVLAALAAFGIVVSVVGLWAAATTLNTDRWVRTVAPLPQNPAVAAAVSQYTTDQLFGALDVEQRLRDALPPAAAFVAAPLTGQVHDAIGKTVERVLRSDRFQPLWTAANRQAHQQAIAIVEGTSTVVRAAGDTVRIDLLPLINQVLRLLSDQLPTLFGKRLSLPDISSGTVPPNLRARVADALGVSLPANFAQFTVYDAGRLRAVQRTVLTAKRGLVAFGAGTLLLLVLALVVAPGRRRTLLQLGLWLVVAAVAVTASLRAVRAQLLAQVPEGVYRDGVAATVTIVTGTLRSRGVQLIWLGALLALAAYLVGPGRVPVWLRRHAARGARTAGRWLRRAYRAVASRGPAFSARHRDLLRVAGVAVAVVLALLVSSWPALLVVAAGLAAFEIGVTLIGRSAT